MRWCRDVSTRSGCFLACSAIHCCFVYVLVELRVSSSVSHQWVCSGDAPLPSSGSRWPRFPAFGGTIRTLRLPALAWPSAYWFRQPAPQAPAGVRVRHERSRRRAGPATGRGLDCSRWPSLSSVLARGQKQDLPGSLAIRPVTLRRSTTPDDPLRLAYSGASGTAPTTINNEGVIASPISRLHAASSPAVYASRRALPHAMQDSLPAGGLRLCRAGVEPAESRREVSVHSILLSRA